MAKGTAIVIGAGIVGIAMARALALKGFAVKVFERSDKANGASIRNFGMIWPIGQPSGKLFQRAIRTRNIWKEMSEAGVFWHDPAGSLHLAYHQDEWNVLQELHEQFKGERLVELLTPGDVQQVSTLAKTKNLFGGLYSQDEIIVEPREAIAALPGYLTNEYGIEFLWNKCVQGIHNNTVIAGKEKFPADLVIVCSGVDFETLFPEQFARVALTKCKLQMMRLTSASLNRRIGPAICAGLSLIHYKSFKDAPSLPALKKRYEDSMRDYIKWGIHVMVSQNETGELTIGDSHEYGNNHDPFDKGFINNFILDYLHQFAETGNWLLSETWHGLYSKLTNGDTEIYFSTEPGVFILNGLGGAGMTLSFGLAEELVEQI